MSRRNALRRPLSLTVLVGLVCAAFASCAPPEFTFKEQPELPDAAGGTDGTGSGGTGSGGTNSQVDAGANGGEGGDAPLPDHCTNRVKDADEVDTDCAGLDCDKCAVGRSCEQNSDCVNNECNAGKCQAPTCLDEERNNGETDVDCGGENCGPCGAGDDCVEPSDCSSGVCVEEVCQAPSCDDRVKNGTEVDVDCGGPCEDLCDIGQACVLNGDCAMPPSPESETVSCDDGICTLHCGSGKADCDQAAANGCETFINDDPEHCGSCEIACTPDNGVGQCNGGVCEIATCNTDFDNCDGEYDNGCEVNLKSDPDHCGTCATNCSEVGGTKGCSGGTCTITCDPGRDDCDNNVANGCEVDITKSVLHCDGCTNGNGQHPAGETCEASSGLYSAFCDGGECGETLCDAGTGDCDGDQDCDSDLTTVNNCGGCGIACVVNHNTPTCVDDGGYKCEIGTCVQNATNKWENCNASDPDGGISDGCERDLLNDPAYCGNCTTNCTTKIGTQNVTGVKCNGVNGCQITSCAEGYADCDGVFSNGCEVQKSNNQNNCGGCGVDCDVAFPHASATCVGVACVMGSCDSGWGNCSTANPLDGCETDLDTTRTHCGACNQVCVNNDGVTSSNECFGGVCQPECTGAGELCDADPRNGCEDTNGDEANCGDCGVTCAQPSGTASTTCSAGNCVPTCSNTPVGRYENCDSSGANGCEDKHTNDNHCGVCGRVCDETGPNTNNVSNNCQSGVCVNVCDSGFDSCDNEPWDGCETNINSNKDHCGGCNMPCLTNAVTSNSACNGSGSCSAPTCTGNGFNCDGNNRNGCEDRDTNDNHCGVCNRVCSEDPSANNVSNNCTAGVCVNVCDPGYDSCDNEPWDGCETQISSNSNHCGACNNKCGGAGTNVQSASCSNGTCSVTCTAASNMCPDTSKADRPCNLPKGTTSNCQSCGQSCSGSTPLCTATGCNDHHPITIVPPPSVGTVPNDRGKSDQQVFTFDHSLENALGKHRAVVVGVAMHGNSGVTLAAEYDGVPMSTAISEASTNGGYHRVAIFYILDDFLPEDPGTYQIEISRSESYGATVASALELLNVDQTTPVEIDGSNSPKSTATSGNCAALPGGTTATHSVPVAGKDQVIFSVYGSLENSGASGTPSNQSELWDSYQAPQITGMMGYKQASSAQTVGWTTISPCWGRFLASAVFRSRTTGGP